MDKPDELLAGILNAVVHIKKREDQLRRTTRDIRTVAANLMAGFSNIILNCNNLSIVYNKLFKILIKFNIQLTISNFSFF